MDDRESATVGRSAGWFRRLQNYLVGPEDANELRSEYHRDYLLLLKSEFSSFSQSSPVAEPDSRFIATCRALESKIRADLIQYEHRATLAELFELEMIMLTEMPEWAVRAKVWSARAVYHKLVGDELYGLYLAGEPPNPRHSATPVQQIQSDLYDLTKGKHWWYLNSIVMEHGIRRYRSTLRRWMTKGMLAVLTVNLLSHSFGLFFPEHGTYAAAFSAVFTGVYAGILGATVSIARRVKAATDVPLNDTDPVIRLSTIVNGDLGIQFSICIGGAFALVLYFMFVAGAPAKVLAPEMLPKFCSGATGAGCGTTLDMFTGLIPSTATDLSKMLLWCFVAGFAEKFVPDILDRLAGMGHPASPPASILPNSPTKGVLGALINAQSGTANSTPTDVSVQGTGQTPGAGRPQPAGPGTPSP
jgi:hypothetical protein